MPDNQISNELTLEKYNLQGGFYAGINNLFPGSGYIEFHKEKLFIVSSRGILAFANKFEQDLSFHQIKNNINKFIDIEQFRVKGASIKDLFIHDNQIYLSFTEEIKENCWNTSIIFGKIDYSEIVFSKLFSSDKCVHAYNNVDGEFEAYASGGRMAYFDDKHILLTVGEFQNRYLAQEEDNINGKIIKINITNSNYEIISKGHRNPQGLLIDKENNFILETEHGPMGGDEINLIEIDKLDVSKKVINYGWPISSQGKFYGDKNSEINIKRYKKYPLYNSHEKHGFIEPMISFQPGIGISQIVKIAKNKYVLSSMKARSIYFFEINEKKIFNFKKLLLNERIRDIIFQDNKLILFLESTASIGIIKINNK